jgi:hypothetical protein
MEAGASDRARSRADLAERITWEHVVRVGIAGVVGTLAFDIFCFLATRQWWDIPVLLGERLGTGLFGGVLAHYANGIVLAIIFAGLIPLFRGPIWLRAVQSATLQTVFGVWLFMMPIMGMGALGLKMGAMMPVMTLIRHWAYGAVMGLVYVRLFPR